MIDPEDFMADEGMSIDDAAQSGGMLDPSSNPDPWGAQSEPPPEVVARMRRQSADIADNFTTDWSLDDSPDDGIDGTDDWAPEDFSDDGSSDG